MEKRAFRHIFSFFGLLVFGTTSVLNATGGKRLTPDDLFRLEEIGEVALSPDGKWLAYVVKRPLMAATMHKQDFLWGNDRGDIWLARSDGGAPKNLTNGATDGSGYWAPSWSPDSRRLTLLSTRGGNVRLWGWEQRSGKLKPLTERGVEPYWVDSKVKSACVWVSDDQVLFPVLPEGQRPLHMIIELQAAETAIREWPKAWKGDEPTASVLKSGVAADVRNRPQGQILSLNLARGRSSSLVEGNVRDVRLSPDSKHFSSLRAASIFQPQRDRVIPDPIAEQYGLVVSTIQGRIVSSALADLFVLPDSCRWAREGSRIAFIGHPKTSQRSSAQVYRFSLASNSVESVTDDRLEPLTVRWTSSGLLVVAARRKEASDQSEPANRTDWWAVGQTGGIRNLTREMEAAPAQLYADSKGMLFGVATGDLWRIYPDERGPQNLTEAFEPKIVSIVWPHPPTLEALPTAEVIVRVEPPTTGGLYRFDLHSGALTKLDKPAPEAELADFSTVTDTAVFTSATRSGTVLWSSNGQDHRIILETNTFLGEIAEGGLKKIEYRSLDGKSLKGWVVLPVGYNEGEVYPLITWVYAGAVFGDRRPYLSHLNHAGPLNLQLLAALGYAVLFPSMPLPPMGEASDPYMELGKGVLPAVDKVIELGIADPERLGVMGHSFGGFSTYGLITQTDRFKAAVSLAGPADFVSMYGTFDARFRYGAFPHERVFSMWLAEKGQHRMGSPPWQDEARYHRNSPLSYAERIQTPLMIVQGDMDYVAIQQGEQIFSALYRQNKRAEFVRYWGEGHVIRSPANIRDLWERIQVWFDEFLK